MYSFRPATKSTHHPSYQHRSERSAHSAHRAQDFAGLPLVFPAPTSGTVYAYGSWFFVLRLGISLVGAWVSRISRRRPSPSARLTPPLLRRRMTHNTTAVASLDLRHPRAHSKVKCVGGCTDFKISYSAYACGPPGTSDARLCPFPLSLPVSMRAHGRPRRGL